MRTAAVTVSTPSGLRDLIYLGAGPCSLFSWQPTEGKWVVWCVCARNEHVKDEDGVQLGAWLVFLLCLNSPLSLSRNSSQRSLSFSLRALVFALQKVHIRHKAWAHPVLLSHSGSCSHDLFHLLIKPGLEFYAKILGLMLIFSEFPCQEIPQTLVIPHT